MDAAQARQMLDQADQVGAQVRGVGRWYALYATAYGLASAGCALAIGLIPDIVVSMAILAVVWGATVIGLSVYSARQTVTPRHFRRTHLLMIVAWTLAWTLVIVGGPILARDPVTWYVPGAALTAVPPLAAAVIVLRSSRGEVRG